jgi:hypothetical protein
MKNLIQITGEIFGLALLAFAFVGTPQKAGATVILNCGDAGSTFGETCSLDELIEGGNFTINDKQFLNWDLGLFSGQSINSELIRVDLIDSLLNPGFTLVDTGLAFRLENGVSSNNELTFDINILGGPSSIVDNELTVAFGEISGDASAEVFEDVADNGGRLLSSLSAVCSDAGCANSTLSDTAVFTPQTFLQVLKDIDLISGTGSVAQINTITQTFSQQVVPEPSIFILLLTGITLGLPWLGYRTI